MNCLSMLNLSTLRLEKCEFKNVEYFIECYNAILGYSTSQSNQIFDEFVSYKRYSTCAWESAKGKLEGDSGIVCKNGCDLEFYQYN